MNDLLRDLLALSIASSGAIAVVLLMRRTVRRAFGAVAAYFMWLLVPVAMIAVLLPDAPAVGSTIGVSFHIEPFSIVSRAIDRSLAPSTGAGAAINGSAWLFGAWCAGVALCFLYLAGLQRAFISSLGALSGSRGVLRAQTSAGCPALIGVFAPKVVLPNDFATRFSRLERRLVIAHERVHLRRLDALSNAFVALFRCVFWFNPLVHLAAGYLRLDQELACDADVVGRHPGSRRVYAGAMLKAQAADAALPVGCHWQSASQFRERLEMLKRSAPGRARRLGGSVFVALAAAAVGYSAWAAEPGAADAAASTAAPANPAHGSDSYFTVNVDDTVLTLETNYNAKLWITGSRVSSTQSVAPSTERSLRLHGDVTFASAPGQPSRVTIARPSQGAPSEVLTATAFVIGGDDALVQSGQEGPATISFERGCVVRLIVAGTPERSISGSVCRMEAHAPAP